MKGDLIEVSKIMMHVVKTRGHRFKIRGEGFEMDLRGRFFIQKVVDLWNDIARGNGSCGYNYNV